MTSIFIIAAEKLLALMCFFALGFYLSRRKLTADNAPQTLSTLLTTCFCPALTIDAMAANLNLASVRSHADLLLASCILMIVGIPVSRVLSRALAGEDADLRAILQYNLLFTNFGYIGYPMILGIFGEAALARYLLYVVPVNVAINLYGRVAVEGRKLSFRSLLNPLALSTLLGLLIGIAGIRLPRVAADVLSAAGACTGPVSMLLTGMVLSRVDLKGCFLDRKNYLFSALRLVILPLAALGIMRALGVRGEALLFTGCFLCFPFGSNPVVFREALGMDSQKAAGMTLVSYMLSLATFPMIISLFHLSM